MKNENKLYSFKEFVQLCFCENGQPSSKRVVGTFMIIMVMISTIVAVCLGHTEFLESVLQTCLIVGSSLLGLSSVTSIWKHDDKEFTAKAGSKTEESSEEN